MSNIWEKFDKNIDTEGLKEDVKDAENEIQDFDDIPDGNYEVAIEKMELTESKKGSPMLTVWMKIVAGEHKGRLLFLNQVVDNGYGLHNANQFLRGMDTKLDIKFENYKQYYELIEEVREKIDEIGLEYLVNQSTNDKGFTNYKIEEVYEIA